MTKKKTEKICLNIFEYLNITRSKSGMPEPCIYAWYRDPKTKIRKKLTFWGFEPYFFVHDKIKVPTFYFHKKTNIRETLVKRMERIPSSPGQVLTLNKIYTYLPHQVRLLRRILESWGKHDYIMESDIEFLYRFLIDKKIKSGLEKVASGFIPTEEDIPSHLRIIFLDLEIRSKKRPNPRKLRKEEEIICCTIWDNYSKKYYVLYQYDTPVKIKFPSDTRLIYCKNERFLLRKIAKLIIELDPDVIGGYNIDWDMVALVKTMEQRHMLNPDILSPLRKVKVRTARKKLGDILISAPRARIWGRSVMDLLELYLMVHLSGLDEMTLEYVAKIENLPAQKILVPDFWDTWFNNPQLIINRNREDVHIYVELDKKLNLIAFADEKRKLVGCRLKDTLSAKKMLDIFLMRMKGNRIMPTARSRGKKYIGAFVYPPVTGLYDWIIQVDYSHLYPSIMIGFNIDPDTFMNPHIWKGPLDQIYKLDDTHAFMKSPKGLLPTLLEKLLDLRKEKKKLQRKALANKQEKLFEMYKLQEGAVKVLANATYGVMGYRFRKGSTETIESVTLIGRNLLLFAIEKIEETGRKVIYGDTDSVFFEPKSKTLDDCIKEGMEVQAMVHSALPKFLKKFNKTDNQPFVLEPAKIYSSFFILDKKKRYAGWLEWNSKRGKNLRWKLDIKGLETKRSDVSTFGRKIQKEVIKRVLHHQPRDDILKWLDVELNSFDKLGLMQIGIPAALGKPLKAYKGNSIQKVSAIYSNKHLKTSFFVGSKPKRLYIKEVPEGMPETHTLSIDWNVDVSGFKIDYPKMLEVTIQRKIEKLLKIININWEDIHLRKELVKPPKKKRRRKKKNVKKKKGQKTLSQFTGGKGASRPSKTILPRQKKVPLPA